MDRLSLTIVIQMFIAATVSAQQWVAGDGAVSTVKSFFTAQQVWAFSPEAQRPVYMALSPTDRVRSSVLTEKAAREGGDEEYKCWVPHHGFSDSADGQGTQLLICYYCHRAALIKGGIITWFTIGVTTETEMNALFHKYNLPGSKAESTKRPEPAARLVTPRAEARGAPAPVATRP